MKLQIEKLLTRFTSVQCDQGSIKVVDRKIADKIHVSNFSLFLYFIILFFLSLKILLTDIFYSAGTSSSVVSAAS
ncbi:hypothetical protein [Lactococcus lactis]|uniref:hypothetical protein n=1 Tax=Lactococcus lactis TaxID=1358 RepID=UPI0024A7EB9B|nr:hypothetical protein [Lactococcus lactis]